MSHHGIYFRQLVDMYQRYSEAAGLRILGFPCNQFGGQEPGTEANIKEFATGKYNVTFDMFSKINVNGGDAHPLWVYLKVTLHFTLLIHRIATFINSDKFSIKSFDKDSV